MPITDYNNKKPLQVTSQNDSGSTQGKAQPILFQDQDPGYFFEPETTKGWTGDTSKFIAQSNFVIQGTSTGALQSESNFVDLSVSSPSFPGIGSSLFFKIASSQKLGGETGTSNKYVLKSSNGTVLGRIEMRHNTPNTLGDASQIVFFNGSNNQLKSSFSANTVYSLRFEFDFANNDAEIFLDGTSQGTFALQNSASDFDQIDVEIENSDSHTAYIDEITGNASPVTVSDTGSGDVVIDFDQVNGPEDIGFYDQNGNLLDYEIESIDTGAGTAVVWAYDDWVRDDTVQAQVAYGNNSANTDRQNVTGTWNNAGQNAEMVHHLDEITTPFFDSTSNNNDSSSVTGTQQTSGVFGEARDFDGTDDGIVIPDSNSLDLSKMTIVCFLRSKQAATVDNAPQRVVQKKDIRFFIGNADFGSDGNPDQVAAEGFDDNGNRLFLFDGDTSASQIGGDDTFHQIGFTYDEAKAALFTDGARQKQVSSSTPIGTNSSDLTVGFGPGGGKNVDGVIDAVRIFSESKSVEWFAADFDASPKGGQVYFSQQAAQPVSTDKTVSVPETVETSVNPDPQVNVVSNVSVPVSASAASSPTPTVTPGQTALNLVATSNVADNPVLNVEPGTASLQTQVTPVTAANPDFTINSSTTLTLPETETSLTNPGFALGEGRTLLLPETQVSSTNPGFAVQPSEVNLELETVLGPVQNPGFNVNTGDTSFQISSSQLTASTENPSVSFQLSLNSPTKGIILNKNRFAVMESHTFKQNDLADTLKATLKDQNGNIDLTGAQEIRIIANDRQNNNVLSESMTVADAKEGEVEYDWQEGDFVEDAGVYRVEFEIEDGTGTVETVPNDGYITVEVEEELN